jgi:parallel beta-helix repeat protein
MISTAAVVVLFFAAFTAVASATDYYVRTGGLDDPGHDGLANDDAHAWKTISYAIGRDEVTAGDTIHVAAGEYTENLDVNKSITLEGEGADVVTVRAASTYDHVFEVTAGYVGISGFAVTGSWSSGKAGIYLNRADNCNISNNNASNNSGEWGGSGIHLSYSSDNTLTNNIANSNNEDGIYLRYSNNNTLRGNTISNNGGEWGGSGIHLFYSSNNTLTNNNASNNRDGISLGYSSSNTLTGNTASNNSGKWSGSGIHLDNSNNNTFTNNTMSGNDYNFGVCCGGLSGYTQNIDTSNTVDGKPIYYWVNHHNQQVPSDAGFVGIVNSTNITVRDIVLTKNPDGVLFAYTEDSRIENVSVSNNERGICLLNSNNNTLTNNTASNNRRNGSSTSCGIRLINSNNNTLTNNNATSNGLYGIEMGYSSNNTLTNNTASNNFDGIRLINSNNNTLTNNTANSNHDDGICLGDSSSNTLTGNTANSNHDDGVHLSYSDSNTLANGNISNNSRGINMFDSSSNTLTNNTANSSFGVFGGRSFSDYIHNIGTSNTVDGKPIYYWSDRQDETVSCDAGFVAIVNSTNITVRDLILTKNFIGVLFVNTDNSRIENVTASNNDYCGIHLLHSSRNTLTGNTALNNTWCGVYLCSSSNNTLTDNNASNNDWHGIRLYSSSNNFIYHNNLLNNTNNNAYDRCTNHWNSTTAGNYYSDYAGNDTNDNGIGDDPHPIPGGSNMDHHPLMSPWREPQTHGDLNGDGKITPADAAITLRIAAGSRPCNPTTLAAADVSGDGRVTSLDALMILQAAAGNMSL